jgi:hypothetical protein
MPGFRQRMEQEVLVVRRNAHGGQTQEGSTKDHDKETQEGEEDRINQDAQA